MGETLSMDDETLLDQQLVQAWLRAGEDLGIEVVAPFVLPVDGGEIRCVALARDFGHRNGMLVRRGGVTEWWEDKPLLDRAVDLGYGVTHLGKSYKDYDRLSFIDALNDWGWRGDPDAAPDWYTGEPWTT
jgi:hypothetical protein